MIANGYLLGEAVWAECDSFDEVEKLALHGVAGAHPVADAAVRRERPFRDGVIVLMVMADISINLSEYQKRIFSPGPRHTATQSGKG